MQVRAHLFVLAHPPQIRPALVVLPMLHVLLAR
jgi:hypothetical protein